MENFWNGFEKQAYGKPMSKQEETFWEEYDKASYKSPASFAAFMTRPENQKKLKKYYASNQEYTTRKLSKTEQGSVLMSALGTGLGFSIPGAVFGGVSTKSLRGALAGAAAAGLGGMGLGALAGHSRNKGIDDAKSVMKMSPKKRKAHFGALGDKYMHDDLEWAMEDLGRKYE